MFSKVNKLNPNLIEISNPVQRAQFEKANKYTKQYCQSEMSCKYLWLSYSIDAVLNTCQKNILTIRLLINCTDLFIQSVY